MNTCSICTSEHRTTIDAMLLRGISAYKIIEELHDRYGVRYSKSAVYRHRKNCVLLPRKNSVYGMLYETGNRRLVRAIERTQKTIKTHNYCRCNSNTNRELRRKGFVWICSICGGWVPYNLGKDLKRKCATNQRINNRIVATGRTY